VFAVHSVVETVGGMCDATSPEDASGIISWMCFGWIFPYIRMAYKNKKLVLGDLPPCTAGDDPTTNFEKFHAILKDATLLCRTHFPDDDIQLLHLLNKSAVYLSICMNRHSEAMDLLKEVS
jgi:hypothetical protein